MTRLLHAIGLDRREARSWALYDWANSAFATTIITAVLPVYYSSVAGKGLPGNTASVYWGYTSAIGLLVIALCAPVLGAMADYLGAKKRFMGGFVGLGVVATALLYFVGQGDWLLASCIFVVANIGFAGANVFYDALLPSVAAEGEMDRLSVAGYALGYTGGGLLLVVNALMIAKPTAFHLPDQVTATRLAMLSVAVWWGAFAIPLFRDVPEPARQSRDGEAAGANPVGIGFARLAETFRDIRRYKQLLIFLMAYWLYTDGIGSIIKLGTIYATEKGIPKESLLGAVVMTQFVGIPCAFAFGWLATRIGAKRGLTLALLVYTAITVFAYFITQAWHFWLLAFGIATVQGGSQALSRSLFASMVPPPKTSEFFAFYGVSEKFAGILGPLLFAVIGQLTHDSRQSILSLVIFFIAGLALLSRVDVREGQAAATSD